MPTPTNTPITIPATAPPEREEEEELDPEEGAAIGATLGAEEGDLVMTGAITGEATGETMGATSGEATGETTGAGKIGATTENVTGITSVHTQLWELLAEHEEAPNVSSRETETPVPEVPRQIGSESMLDTSAGPL